MHAKQCWAATSKTLQILSQSVTDRPPACIFSCPRSERCFQCYSFCKQTLLRCEICNNKIQTALQTQANRGSATLLLSATQCLSKLLRGGFTDPHTYMSSWSVGAACSWRQTQQKPPVNVCSMFPKQCSLRGTSNSALQLQLESVQPV
jgi:hypothetical protein